MASRTALSKPLHGWQCSQCRHRTFSTTAQRAAFGPEHPRYIKVPEPPQQTLAYRPFIKGRLPVPRNILPGEKGLEKSDPEAIAKSTPRPKKRVPAEAGSREEWQQKMSEVRRRNLREGMRDLRARKFDTESRAAERHERARVERAELRARPEREDERLTAPSHGLDLQKLLHGPLEDPTREARLAHKARNVALHTNAKRAERLDHLHTLYMNARNFIVTPEQLDAAIEEEFNNPKFGTDRAGQSMWAYDPPNTVQEMLKQGNSSDSSRMAMSSSKSQTEINHQRITRIAEKLTGGKMDQNPS